MRSKAFCFLAILAVSLASTANAATYNVDFNNGSSAQIAPTFGDNSEANLSYRGLVALTTDPGWGDIATYGQLTHWTTGYGDLGGAAWNSSSLSRGEIRIDAVAPGQSVTLNSFQLGGRSTNQWDASFYIFDGSWNLLASDETLITPIGGHLTMLPDVASLDGTLILQWGEMHGAWG